MNILNMFEVLMVSAGLWSRERGCENFDGLSQLLKLSFISF